MCITFLWHEGVSAGPEDPVLVLLGKLIGICTSPDTEWPPAKAISQILPGISQPCVCPDLTDNDTMMAHML